MRNPPLAPVAAIARQFLPQARTTEAAGFRLQRHEKEPWRVYVSVFAKSFADMCAACEAEGLEQAHAANAETEATIAGHILDGLARAGLRAKQCHNRSMLLVDLA